MRPVRARPRSRTRPARRPPRTRPARRPPRTRPARTARPAGRRLRRCLPRWRRRSWRAWIPRTTLQVGERAPGAGGPGRAALLRPGDRHQPARLAHYAGSGQPAGQRVDRSPADGSAASTSGDSAACWTQRPIRSIRALSTPRSAWPNPGMTHSSLGSRGRLVQLVRVLHREVDVLITVDDQEGGRRDLRRRLGWGYRHGIPPGGAHPGLEPGAGDQAASRRSTAQWTRRIGLVPR